MFGLWRLLHAGHHYVVKNIKNGRSNDLIERLKNDKLFAKIIPYLEKMLNPKKYIGMAEKQVTDYIKNDLTPIIRKNKG